MIAKAEHAQGPAVVKVIEVMGVSPEGWEDAARCIVKRVPLSTLHVTPGSIS